MAFSFDASIERRAGPFSSDVASLALQGNLRTYQGRSRGVEHRFAFCKRVVLRKLEFFGARETKQKEYPMLRAAIVFFVLALVAMLLGAGGFAGVSLEIGRTLLVVFLILAVISFIASLVGGRKPNVLPAVALLGGVSAATAQFIV